MKQKHIRRLTQAARDRLDSVARLALGALAALIPLVAALALATPSHAYLHLDWGCVGDMSLGHDSDDGWWFGKTGWGGIQDNRNFNGNAGSQALDMTADNMASRWNGWAGYRDGASWRGNYTRYGSGDLQCEVAHRTIFLNGIITTVRVKGSDDGLHGYITYMRVTRERSFNPSLVITTDKAVSWDPCTSDAHCNMSEP